jgi:hypothetical protein
MKYILISLLLTGCTTIHQYVIFDPVLMQDIHIDNNAKNNFVGNPCKFYIGQTCLLQTPKVRNPDNPYTK